MTGDEIFDQTGTEHAAGSDGAHRTPVAIPSARTDDPHMRDAARHPERVEGIVALFFLVGIAGVAGFGVAYWMAASPWVLAVTFGVGLFALGFGLTAWGKYLMPQGPFVEERHRLASDEDAREAMAAALVERTGVVVKRRKMLGGLFAGGMGIFSIVALFPLLRSLGPKPEKRFDTTAWRKGSLLVDSTGTPIHRDQLEVGGVITVFPKGSENTPTGQSINQAILIRLLPTEGQTNASSGFHTDTGGYVAYSKLCTHLGCPVGLYERELEVLVCPCHQSMFRVGDGGLPKFGPAPRPLPQLRIMIDRQGLLRARGGFDQAVGPGFWERSSAPPLFAKRGGK